MPVTATGLADIGARDPQPLVLGRRPQHAPQQLAVAGLQFGALLQLSPSHGNPPCQRVTYRLQLSQVQRPPLARDGRNPSVDLQAWKGIGEKRPELLFQAADLAP